MGCPGDFKPSRGVADNSAVVRGLSWLVDEAVACDFEDNGKEYIAAAKQVRASETFGSRADSFEEQHLLAFCRLSVPFGLSSRSESWA